jgi:hypothetical protein
MKTKKILLFLFLFFLLSLTIKSRVLAADPHLFLSPASGNYSQDFNLELRVDTGGQAVGGVDVLLEFPKNLLNAQQVTKGTAFSEVFSSIKNNEGKLIIGAYFSTEEAGKSYNGTNGLIATLSFKPLGNGTASINFVCSPNLVNESNIVEKINSTDIIVCSANVNGSYTLTTNNQSNPTPTPTPKQTPTLTPTPAPNNQSPQTSPNSSSPTPTPIIPVTGSTIQTLGMFGLGLVSLLTGLLLIF